MFAVSWFLLKHEGYKVPSTLRFTSGITTARVSSPGSGLVAGETETAPYFLSLRTTLTVLEAKVASLKLLSGL